MKRVTARLMSGQQIVLSRLPDRVQVTVDGYLVGELSLEAAWRLMEGIDRIATGPP